MQETRFDLAKSELFALSDIQDHVLSCGSGELWITVDGDRRDIILAPGESLRIESRVPVVITALRASTLNLLHPQAAASWKARMFGVLNALSRWKFPPLASFPSPMIR
ncbi:MAG: DUF2917 domain-containing protein [Proteobacteria bacterium]|nr:DUF2917 domain-containing protein [Pseudomonadota bacterium]